MQIFKAFYFLMEKVVFVSGTIICILIVSIVLCFFNLSLAGTVSSTWTGATNE